MPSTGQRIAWCMPGLESDRHPYSQMIDASSRQTVVHVTPTYVPVLGGTERFVERLSEVQEAAGHRVRVLTSSIGLPRRESSTSRSDPRVVRLPGFMVANTPVIPRMPLAIARLERDALVHVHIANVFTPEVVSAACRLRRLPCVAHLHLDPPPSSALSPLLRLYKPVALAAALRAAGAIIVFTDAQADEVARRYRVARHRIHVVPNGVDQEFLDAGLLPRQERTGAVRLLFVGRLGPTKNVEGLLNVIADLPGSTLDIVGDGPLRHRLERQAERLAAGRVTFHGTVKRSSLVARYREADVFVLPSAYEGMPLALLEAMACGLPAVASDITGIRELIEPGVTGELVPVGDTRSLRSTLERLIADSGQRSTMGTAATEAARSYSWRSVAEACEKIYATASAAPQRTSEV